MAFEGGKWVGGNSEKGVEVIGQGRVMSGGEDTDDIVRTATRVLYIGGIEIVLMNR